MPLLISKLWKCQVARKGSVDNVHLLQVYSNATWAVEPAKAGTWEMVNSGKWSDGNNRSVKSQPKSELAWTVESSSRLQIYLEHSWTILICFSGTLYFVLRSLRYDMNWYELIWYDTMSYCYIHAQLNDSKYMSTWCDFWTFLDLSAVNVSCWDGLQWREEPERFWRHGCLSRAAAPSGANLHLGKVDWWWGP